MRKLKLAQAFMKAGLKAGLMLEKDGGSTRKTTRRARRECSVTACNFESRGWIAEFIVLSMAGHVRRVRKAKSKEINQSRTQSRVLHGTRETSMTARDHGMSTQWQQHTLHVHVPVHVP